MGSPPQHGRRGPDGEDAAAPTRTGRRLRRAGGLAVAVVLTAGAVAVAQSTFGERVVVTDDRGDAAKARIDITRVQLERASDGRLRGALTAAADWDAADLEATGETPGPPGSLCLRLYDLAGSAGEKVPDHLVCVTSHDGEDLRGSVLEIRPNDYPRRVARATVTRPSDRSVVVKFSQSSVGRPDTLRFAGESNRPGCTTVSCIDAAPDLPSTGRLKLREPEATTNRPEGEDGSAGTTAGSAQTQSP